MGQSVLGLNSNKIIKTEVCVGTTCIPRKVESSAISLIIER